MPTQDSFEGFQRKPAGGPANLFSVTPDDAADLPYLAHWLHISQGGQLTLATGGGQVVTLESVLPGWHAIEVRRVHATGTTATGIVAGW
ncbi:MAG: hypothetical protein JJ872_01690 [Marivivens sp.]|nr:hypothetical protein [Marivivens sp.]